VKITKEEIKLRRAWISQLYVEHESVCWAYRIKLSRPIIEVSNSETEWGSWDADFRTMRFSSHFIREHSWDVVINILKHEMAHQIVSEMLDSVDGHGDLFRRAGHMIGLPQEFSKASGDIPRKLMDFRKEEIVSDNVRILEKVKKCLSLAQSNNENEAFIAMKKANELIEKYNIERIEQGSDSKYVHAIINHKKKRIENYQRSICLILKDYFFVEVVYSYLYDADNGETYKTIEILGTAENVIMAEYVYHFLLNQLEILWNAHKSKRGYRSNKKKRSYWLGVLRGFGDKLAHLETDHGNRQKPDTEELTTTSALICAQDKMLTHFLDMRFPRLHNHKPQSTTLDRSTFRAGIKDGKQLTLHRGVTQNSSFQGKLLSIKQNRSED
jgi:hypothetical protein